MHVALYALLCVIWGSTWLVIKVGYGGLGPFNVAAIRFFVAGAVFAPLVPLLGARWPRGRAEWTLVVLVGVVLFAADYGLIYWAEQSLDSGLTAILFATLPLITVALAHVYLPGDRITPRKLAGTTLVDATGASIVVRHDVPVGFQYAAPTSSGGQPVDWTVKSVDDQRIVTTTPNPHPLAGLDLTFDALVESLTT